MKVIFLDFDGVLNSEGSFNYEYRRRTEWKEQGLGKINKTFCNVCASNFQAVLDRYPEVKVVISSTWRIMFDMDWFINYQFPKYHIDASRIIGKTPDLITEDRGKEILTWIEEWNKANPKDPVKHYISIDDNDDISEHIGKDRFVHTSWFSGMTWAHTQEAIFKLKTPKEPR